jgi:hypothetical protein
MRLQRTFITMAHLIVGKLDIRAKSPFAVA